MLIHDLRVPRSGEAFNAASRAKEKRHAVRISFPFGCGGGTCNHRIARKCVRGRLFGAARSHPTRRGGSEVVRRLNFVSKKEQHPCGCCSFFGCGGGTCNHRIARKCVRGRLFGAARRHQATVCAFASAHSRYAAGESPPGLTEDMRIRL